MDYRKLIDSYKAGHFSPDEIQEHLSDLMLFMDFSSSLNRTNSVEEVANLLLLTLMGCTRSGRSAFFVCKDARLKLVDSKGARFHQKELQCGWKAPYSPCIASRMKEDAEWLSPIIDAGFHLILPISQEDRLLAVVALGGKSKVEGHALQVVVSLCEMTAGALENAQSRQVLQVLNRQLTLKVYQLKTLFELSKDFNATWDSEGIFRILGSTLIGQLLVSRCAVLTVTNDALEKKFLRGFRWLEEDLDFIQRMPVSTLFTGKSEPLLTECLPPSDFRQFLDTHKIHLLFPMILNDEIRGLILLGEKRNRKPFGQDDFDLITTLGYLALVADENARMQQEMIEKQRMERELAIARQIQVGLLPQSIPKIRGYEITSVFEPCYTVGGDYFDFLPVSESEIAVAIADVSGKSTPAALLMASLQASLRTLCSVEFTEPKFTMKRLNQLLCDSQSQTSKYVTFFYGILKHSTGDLIYVNAGHCYPLVLKPNGDVHKLDIGGTVLGFFRDAKYSSGTYNVQPGDVMIFYTDGVSELTNAKEEEFGVDRIVETLRTHSAEPILVMREALQKALHEHRGAQHQGDDITFILLKRQEQ
jgi:sigma-B regulation protein RsbU (phosphoserine phosphatase)